MGIGRKFLSVLVSYIIFPKPVLFQHQVSDRVSHCTPWPALGPTDDWFSSPHRPQAGIVVFFAGLFISWASSWSSPPAPSPALRPKESPAGRETWEELPAGDEESEWIADGGLVRSRRESLWEEAEIDRLDLTERTGRWELDSTEQGRTPQSTRGPGSPFRRGSAMSLLHQLLGQEPGTDSEGGGAGREVGRVLPRETNAQDSVSVCTGGDLNGGCSAGQEVTLRSPKFRQLHDSCTFLNPPPFGPR